METPKSDQKSRTKSEKKKESKTLKEGADILDTDGAVMPDPQRKFQTTEEDVRAAFTPGEGVPEFPEEKFPEERLPESQGDEADQAEEEQEGDRAERIREIRNREPKSA